MLTTTALPKKEASTADPTSGYMAVQLELLRGVQQSSVDMFVRFGPRDEPSLYYRAGCPFEADQIPRLLKKGTPQIFVRSEDVHLFASDLLKSIDARAENERVPPEEHFAALQLSMAVEIEHAARLIDSGPYVGIADKLGRDLTSLLANNQVLPRDLFRLARHDFNTFTHITNVASYSVILAEQLGLCCEVDLESLAKAAILHDIGKRHIPASILQKPTKLTPKERAIIETHPQRGYEELCSRDDMTYDQLMVVYQHHERFDGAGYPVGYQGEEIHPWARMLAVVDVFDAMTGTRPYRRPTATAAALEYIRNGAGTHFDPEMVACWNSIMAKT